MDVEDKTNRSLAQPRVQKAPPCTLVIFGAGGDLTKRLLMPAIYNLAKARLLSEKFAIIAVDRTPKPVEDFRAYLAEGVRSFISDTASGPATEPFDQRAWEFVASRINHFSGDLTEPDTYARLHDVLKDGNAPPDRRQRSLLSRRRFAIVRNDRRSARRRRLDL